MSDPTRTAADGEAELTRTSDPSTLPEHPDTRTHDPDGTTAAGGVEHPAVPARAGSLLADRYRLTAVIGEGGMGSVWRAEQTHPVKRAVAVKLILAGRDSKAVLARFDAERQALAVMDHPHIAKVLDAGTTAGGQPYFVMELVNGVPLTKFADEHKLTLPQRLDLFQLVCHAVQHAHQKGIIHRDLKPGNVLVGLVDGKPTPKVIDFGLAKALTGPRLTDASADLTGVGSVLGTPLYMAPEQADPGGAVDVDTRADVYALGVILYELLTGTTPIPRARVQKLTLLEVLRLIREEEPPAPSLRLSELRSTPRDGKATTALHAEFRAPNFQDLDWIVMKALAKERERRYESAAALAEDVARHRRHEPVLAGPPTAGYRLRKFVRRNRGQVVAGGLILAALVAGVVGTTLGLFEARHQQKGAEFARGEEEKQRKAAEQERDDKETARKDAVAQKEEAERANALAGRVLDAMTSVTAGDALTSQAVVSPEQRKFLTQAVEYYQQLAAKRGNDDASRKRIAEAATQLGSIQWRLGNKKEAVAALEQARDLFTAFAADHPGDPATARTVHRAHSNLGIAYADAGRGADAERAYRTAIDALRGTAGRGEDDPLDRRELARGQHSLALLLAARGNNKEAEPLHRQALKLREGLAEQFPKNPDCHQEVARSRHNLGGVLNATGRKAEAVEEYEKAITLRAALAEQFPDAPEYRHELARSHQNRGTVLRELNKYDDAAKSYQTSLDLRTKLVAQYPSAPMYRNELAFSLFTSGNLDLVLRKPDAAAERFRQGIALCEKLVGEFPGEVEYRQFLARGHVSLGELARGQKNAADAVAHYQKAIAAFEALVRQAPDNRKYRDDLCRGVGTLGLILADAGRREDAAAQYDKAHTLSEKLVEEFPDVIEYRIGLGANYCNRGELVLGGGKAKDSLPWFDKAVAALEGAVGRFPPNPTVRDFLRNSYWGRARANDQLGNGAGAARDWTKVIDLSPSGERPRFLNYRVNSYLAAGMLAEAAADVEAAANGKQTPVQYVNYAHFYLFAAGQDAAKKAEHLDRAMGMLTRAVKAGYKDAARLAADPGLAPLRDREDFQKLLADLGGKPVPKREVLPPPRRDD